YPTPPPILPPFPTRRSSDLHLPPVLKASVCTPARRHKREHQKPGDGTHRWHFVFRFDRLDVADDPLRLVSRLGRLNFGKVYPGRSEEHTSELQSRFDLVCRL